MPYKPSITVNSIIDALYGFLRLFEAGAEIVQSQQNRVPMPKSPVFVLTPINQSNIETPSVVVEDRDAIITTPTRITIQVDIFGEYSVDLCTAIIAVIRSGVSDTYFQNGMAILHCDDGMQSQFITGEQQFEQRWILQIVMQFNPGVVMPLTTANKLSIHSIEGVL